MRKTAAILVVLTTVVVGSWILFTDDPAPQSPRDVVGYNDASTRQSFRVDLETNRGNESFNFTLSPGKMDESKEFPTRAEVHSVHVYYDGTKYTEGADEFDTCPENSPGDVKVAVLEDTVDIVFICR